MSFDPRTLPGTCWQHRPSGGGAASTLHPPRNPMLVDMEAPHAPLPAGMVVWGQAGTNTPFRGVIGDPGVLSQITQGHTAVDILHWGDGDPINLLALPAGTPGADQPPPALPQAQTTWHTQRVQVQRLSDYPVQHVVDAGGHAVGEGWLVLRGLPAAGGALASNIFLLRTDAHGNVVADRTHFLSRGAAPSPPYTGGAHYQSATLGLDFVWQDFHPGGDRTIRLAPGTSYKSIWLSGDGTPLLGNAPQLLGLLDPAVDSGHSVVPTLEDQRAHRIHSLPVSVAGAFLHFPEDAPPAGADGQPATPLVSRAFDLLRQFNDARHQLEGEPQQQAQLAGAHLIADYFDTSGWILNGDYLRGDQITQAADLVQHEQFQQVEQAQLLVQTAAQRAGHAMSLIADRARDLRDLFAQTASGGSGPAAIQAFTDFVVADPRGRAAWVMSFFAELADHLAEDGEPATATLRRNILEGLTARATNDFTLLYHALTQAHAPAPAASDAHQGQHQIGPPEEGEAPESPEASEYVSVGLETLKSSLEIWGSMLKQRLEIGAQVMAAGLPDAQAWRAQLLHHLHQTASEQADLVEEGPHFLDEMREAREHLHGEELQRFNRELDVLDAQVGNDGFLHRLQANQERTEALHSRGESVVHALDELKAVISGVDLLEQICAARHHLTGSEVLGHARDITSDLSDVLSGVNAVCESWTAQVHPELAEAEGGEMLLGSLAKWGGNALAIVSFGLRVWQVFFPPFHANRTVREEDAEMLELISSAVGLLATFSPPPLDVTFGALGAALEGVNLIFGSIFDFYYSPAVQQLEAMKRRLALFTDYAREPDFFFPEVTLEDGYVVMRGAAAPSQALYQRAAARWRLVVVLAHTEGEGDNRLALPLARRNSIHPADQATDLSLARLGDCSDCLTATSFPWINLAAVYSAEQHEVRAMLMEDLVWLPQWGWGPSTSHPIAPQQLRVEQLARLGLPDDRPVPLRVRVHVLAVEAGTNDEETAEKVWNYFYADDDKAQLVGISEKTWQVTFQPGHAAFEHPEPAHEEHGGGS